MISCTATGLVYGNPKPYLKSRQAFHPTLVRLHDDELLCSYDVGEGVESLDYRTYLSRSDDGGHTWVQQGPLFDDPVERPCSSSVRLTKLKDGTLIGFGIRFYRDDPEEGIVSRESSGFVPMDLFTITSADVGRSWSEPTTLSPLFRIQPSKSVTASWNCLTAHCCSLPRRLGGGMAPCRRGRGR